MSNSSLVRGGFFVLRFLLGVAFIIAGASKIADPIAFADSIATFQLIPPSTIPWIALSLPVLEVLAGGLVIIGFHARVGALAIMFMLTIFTAALIQAIVRGLNVDCGCFGKGMFGSSEAWESLIRDIAMLAAAAAVYIRLLRTSPPVREWFAWKRPLASPEF